MTTKHPTTIIETSGSNETQILDYYSSVGTDRIQGPGSGSEINYNPYFLGGEIVNVDGTKGRPAFIGLLHEILHAVVNASGRNDPVKPADIVDPDTGDKRRLTNAEIKIRQDDSRVRKENRVVERKQPYQQ